MNKRKIAAIIIISIIGIGGGAMLYFFPGFSLLRKEPYEKIEFTDFPIDLDSLFRVGNVTQQNEMKQFLNESTGQYYFWIVSYPNYFHDCHYPATFKWYLYAEHNSPMHLSEDSYLTIEYYHEDSMEVNINGSVIVTNIRAQLQISPYISVHLDHVAINKSIIDSISSKAVFGRRVKAAFIPGNTTFGFASIAPRNAVDFRIIDTSSKNLPGDTKYELWQYSKNPFFYFTDEIQSKLLQYYQPYYEIMKSNGHLLGTRLNNTYDINEENTIFGNWYYKEGPFELNETHHTYEWTSFDAAILTIINYNKTNRETFYQTVDTEQPFNSSMIGVFGDSECFAVDGYQKIGVTYMYLISNNSESNQGIIRLEKYYNNNDWGSKKYIYLKYEFQENSAVTMDDDVLKVQYFDILTNAQGDFTSDFILYSRDPIY